MSKRFLSLILVIVAVLLCVMVFGCHNAAKEASTTTVTTTEVTTTQTTITTTTEAPTTTTTTKSTAAGTEDEGPFVLDPTYQCLLLVNAKNPITPDYDKDISLRSVPKKYCNGSLYQVEASIYPYVMEMLKAAWSEGVKLYVRSPYRSYATQKMLFQNKVNSVIANGTPKENAEAVAAKAVAAPGTSEHQTGFAIDFNTASQPFVNQPAYAWMMEHAQDYGFIMRYPEGKTEITGIMYEPWHWRFVGINVAKEIKQSGLAFEEYMEGKTAQ